MDYADIILYPCLIQKQNTLPISDNYKQTNTSYNLIDNA